MLPTKLSRAAQRATASPPTATCYACLAARRTHQRRHSSSKASSSADRYSNKPTGPATKAANPPAAGEGEQAVTTTPPEARPPQQRNTKGRTRLPRRASTVQDVNKKAVLAEPEDRFASLPSVPSVQSLSESERSISNFFSLHRPMSISHTFPPPSTPEAFSKIFTTEPSQEDAWANGNSAERRPEDVIYTLNSTIENLERNANNEQDDGMRWEIIHESPSNSSNNNGKVHHLDGQPQHRLNLEELVAQFKPFRAPPPPQPFPDYTEEGKIKPKEKKHASTTTSTAVLEAKPKQKTFTTTITVTESTYANGRKTYTASSSPIVSQPLPSTTESVSASSSSTQSLTRKERIRRGIEARQQPAVAILPPRKAPVGMREKRMGRTMFLISVKRQRKLKMKKHKYKKLMKRTRNLRRRLERA